MLFCTQCGNPVGEQDKFCRVCGKLQGAQTPPSGSPPPSEPGTGFLSGISARTASMLCYVPVVGWLAAILVLAAPKFHRDKTTRFHAFQGLYLFVVWLLIVWVLEPMFEGRPGTRAISFATDLMKLTVFAAWVWMLIKTSMEQLFRLPIVGELAERSVAEQR